MLRRNNISPLTRTKSISLSKRIAMLCIVLLMLNAVNVSAQVISNNGAVMSVSSGTVVNNASDVNNTSGTIDNSGTINLTGSWTNSGTFTSGTGSTVDYNGSGPQSVAGLNYYHLTISGATDTLAAYYKTVQSSTNVSGVLTINSGSTLDIGTFTSSTIAGGTNSGKIRWSGSNVYVGGTGTTEFYGSNPATLAPGVSYGNILVSSTGTNTISGAVTAIGGTAAVGVTVNSNLTVSGNLTITGMDLVNNGTITNNGTVTVQ